MFAFVPAAQPHSHLLPHQRLARGSSAFPLGGGPLARDAAGDVEPCEGLPRHYRADRELGSGVPLGKGTVGPAASSYRSTGTALPGKPKRTGSDLVAGERLTKAQSSITVCDWLTAPSDLTAIDPARAVRLPDSKVNENLTKRYGSLSCANGRVWLR